MKGRNLELQLNGIKENPKKIELQLNGIKENPKNEF
jgi:hypothetical protein